MGQYDVTESDVDSDEQGWDGGMKGARLFFGGTGLYVSFFLTGLEGTIVSTSLVAITDDLRGFGRSSWIITSYLLTYAGFLMIWSKAGDIWGVKPMLLVSLAIFTAFSGGCSGARLSMTVSIVEIPQRFQVVNGSSPIGAGVKLLAFAVSVPAGMMFCSILTGRLPVPLVYVGIGGVIMQVVGFFLFSEIKPETHIWPGQFGYLVLSGLGTGLGVAVFYLMLPLVVAVTDQSIALGTGFQLRMLGGALGIAAATAILHSHTRSGLSALLPSDEVDAFSVSTQLIDTLTPSMQSQVREVYAEAYSMQMKMVGGFSAAQFLALGLVWKRQNNTEELNLIHAVEDDADDVGIRAPAGAT
ncbi:hypothetical protein CBS76997_10533 [Aspergillus niger]|nr:hypothetical protein CBS133816_6618 [Aspergillus niger]KAI2869162.1 hypothetical protein CBS13152_10440 [Aspergillus niger]KAI2936022.1 hypothetical protein CBS147320_255 [Aspergillus niger]KAI2958591.1 hypothetical protein CBS147322_1495 [Aspergillus niger]KAI2986377.1 hypothetical protein CBS147344_5537 [Aspergillus niger]